MAQKEQQEPMVETKYYIYMLECSDGSWYTGITSNLPRRMRQHYFRLSGCAKYTKSHPVTKLLAVWETDSHLAAARLEAHIKSLTKSQKTVLLTVPEGLQSVLPDEWDATCYMLQEYTLSELLKIK